MSPISFFGITLFFYFLGCIFFLLDLWSRKGLPPTKQIEPKDEGPTYMDDFPDSARQHHRRDTGIEQETFFSGLSKLPVNQGLAFITTAIGFLCHTIALVTRAQAEVPFSSLQEALSFFSWAMVLIASLVELRYQIYVMGSFTLPVAFLSLISAATVPYDKQTIPPTLKGALLGVHTTLSLLGIVAFAIAAVVGVMYLLQEKFLKSKQFSPIYDKLPSLDLLDQLNKMVLFCGFPLFTLGMITGALWSQYALGSFWSSNNPKQILSILAWFFYLIALQGRMTIGWKARKAAHLAIAGFIGIIFIFVLI